MKQSRVRLYVEHPLGDEQSVPVTQAQAHYLFAVMRLKQGDTLVLFNGLDGEFPAVIEEAGKRRGLLRCAPQSRPLIVPPDLWLIFAPIKKTRTDFIVEKAAEMGAARIMPVRTDFTNSERIRQDRLQAHAVEAAEQCGATFVPEVTDLIKLERLLADWPEDRQLMFCDETLAGQISALSNKTDLGLHTEPWAIIIGPEGGFSESERTRLRAMKQSHAISLGPRILRADTAAIAALALWQNTLGDWV